ncbi:glycosyltransferase family 2 protein [Myroides odoratimimus]|uniref:glycosyltransferase family A protein n=1 Tax=Myroides odoratimimus TaxID=76832 RepID=UPI00103F1EB2|nr:glycosyltransferase family 2 protein [Myroides odoratimimus]QBK77625.1 glycosyltransferase family 2 protein [Myroides odoratimimus]WHT73072.1 glycosyltransferase family 2 protein [Myroides odoratimimus]WHU37655.1 glycosyltransferase family 2 protein [Myroides odoratimimus]
MEKDLLSIITPCYNGETYLHRLCDSILEQTYPYVEFIFVNDGSNDRTEEIILSYESKFIERGYSFIYIYQENGGQAKALNQGLTVYRGEYLTWPDSDDFYLEETALEIMVNSLKNSDDKIGTVRSFATMFAERSFKRNGSLANKTKEDVYNLFEDCLLERDFWFAPICYMAKTCHVKKYVGGEVEVNRIGQNFQMFIPLFCYKDTITIKRDLVGYLVREASHSRDLGDFNKRIERFTAIEALKERLVTKCGLKERERINREVKRVTLKNKILLFVEYNMFVKSLKLLMANPVLLIDFRFIKSYLYFVKK